MYIDVVFPKNNEDTFIQLAYRLGYSALVFVYEPAELKKIEAANNAEHKNVKIYSGMIVSAKQLRKINKDDADIILVESGSDDRDVLESKKADIMFNFENQKRQDFLHHRNSGLNHIIARLAAETGTAVGFSFSNILENKKQRARLLGRLMQNVVLARKFKAKMVFASFAHDPYRMRAAHDMIALLRTFGMTANEAKEGLQNSLNIIKHNHKKRTESYIGE